MLNIFENTRLDRDHPCLGTLLHALSRHFQKTADWNVMMCYVFERENNSLGWIYVRNSSRIFLETSDLSFSLDFRVVRRIGGGSKDLWVQVTGRNDWDETEEVLVVRYLTTVPNSRDCRRVGTTRHAIHGWVLRISNHSFSYPYTMSFPFHSCENRNRTPPRHKSTLGNWRPNDSAKWFQNRTWTTM